MNFHQSDSRYLITSCTRFSGTEAHEEIQIFFIHFRKFSGISSGVSIRREGREARSQIRASFVELLEFFDPTIMRASTSFTSSFTASCLLVVA